MVGQSTARSTEEEEERNAAGVRRTVAWFRIRRIVKRVDGMIRVHTRPNSR